MKVKQTTYRGYIRLKYLAEYLMANSTPFNFSKDNEGCCYIEFKADKAVQEGLRRYQERSDIDLQIHFV